jgi:hypothetical protein
MLYLIWTAGTNTWPLWIATITAGCVYTGFWTALVFRSAYGGLLVDKVNGVPPFNWNLFGLKFQTDANVSLFTPAVILVAATGVMLLQIV